MPVVRRPAPGRARAALERLEDCAPARPAGRPARGRRSVRAVAGPDRPRPHRGRRGRRRGAPRSPAGSRTPAQAVRRPRGRAGGRSGSIRAGALQPAACGVSSIAARSTSSIEHHSALRRRRAALEARQVEQLVDHPRQARLPPRPPHPPAPPARPGAARGGERLAGRADRRQRRAQVVRDGAQQRGLEVVGLRRSACGLDHLALGARRARVRRPAAPRAAARHAPGSGRGPTRAGRPVRAASRCGGSAPGAGTQRGASSDSSAAELDRRGRKLQRGREPLRHRRQRLLEAPTAQQQARHLCGEVGLLPALLGVLGARAGALRERARDDRDDEQRGERNPVLRLADR